MLFEFLIHIGVGERSVCTVFEVTDQSRQQLPTAGEAPQTGQHIHVSKKLLVGGFQLKAEKTVHPTHFFGRFVGAQHIFGRLAYQRLPGPK